jgi:hypothetical protein
MAASDAASGSPPDPEEGPDDEPDDEPGVIPEEEPDVEWPCGDPDDEVEPTVPAFPDEVAHAQSARKAQPLAARTTHERTMV